MYINKHIITSKNTKHQIVFLATWIRWFQLNTGKNASKDDAILQKGRAWVLIVRFVRERWSRGLESEALVTALVEIIFRIFSVGLLNCKESFQIPQNHLPDGLCQDKQYIHIFKIPFCKPHWTCV